MREKDEKNKEANRKIGKDNSDIVREIRYLNNLICVRSIER